MSKDTYEFGAVCDKLETYEWDDGWYEYANDKETFRVLYIGDSVSRGLRYVLNQKADGEVRIDNFATSKAVDNPFFKEALKLFARQETRCDLVLFNNGLHGFHLSDEEYEHRFDEMVVFLMEEFDKKPMEIVLTTYIKGSEERQRTVSERNRAARRVAERYGLEVIDLYDVSYENRELLAKDGVHFTPEGCDTLAEVVLKEIRRIKDRG